MYWMAAFACPRARNVITSILLSQRRSVKQGRVILTPDDRELVTEELARIGRLEHQHDSGIPNVESPISITMVFTMKLRHTSGAHERKY